MLPDLSPTHILIVVVVALVVVGPKDLPMLLRKVGQFTAKMRGMANEFRASFDEMARQSELDDLRKEVEAMRSATREALPNMTVELDPKTDAEGAYMHQWQDTPVVEEPMLPGLPEPDAMLAATTVEASAPAPEAVAAFNPEVAPPKPPAPKAEASLETSGRDTPGDAGA